MSHHIQVNSVILCGGSGTRLWPLSRAGFPKQFLVLSGTTSLFQQAIHRVNGLLAADISLGNSIVVSNEEHRFLILDQLREINEAATTLFLEPVGRNTAPALTLAALIAIENGSDPVLVVAPADQTIGNIPEFTEALQKSIRVADAGTIVILGIRPTKPETGYGYIQSSGEAGYFGEYTVTKFAEKPDLETAKEYIKSSEYSWNSGIFVLKASVWLKALKQFSPDIAAAAENAWISKKIDPPFIRPDIEFFRAIPAESIDYAVMEKCPGSSIPIKMIPLDAGWNDLGAWDAVWLANQSDENGNVSKGDALLVNTKNTYIHASTRLVAAVGLDNLAIVETADAVLVIDKNQSQDVKKIVSQLKQLKRTETDLHRKTFRPWGWYDTIDEGERFKVKRIMVKPGSSLSLQMHHHRAEHWIVVKGTAEITNGDQTIMLAENQSTYIPQGQSHRLRNPGVVPLEIIEVQSGSYLGEDDIVRFEDSYGRSLLN
jgi:mannose-1-phosphate guanylyltransferase/mannose-6-phosphate isomerase